MRVITQGFVAVIIALQLLSISSCKKADTNTNSSGTYPPGFREATCSDTTDDFKFETYNTAETDYLLKEYGANTETPDPNYNIALKLDTRHYDRNNGRLILTSYGNLDYSLSIFVAYNDKFMSSYDAEDLPPGKIENPIIDPNIVTTSAVQPGCYRFYYIVGTPDTTILKKNRTVKYKGHFDLEIVN